MTYFLGIEVAPSSKGHSLFQRKRKYFTDLLEGTGILGSKLIDTPKNPNIHFNQNLGEPLADPKQYRRLIGKLIYLTVARPDITFDVC